MLQSESCESSTKKKDASLVEIATIVVHCHNPYAEYAWLAALLQASDSEKAEASKAVAEEKDAKDTDKPQVEWVGPLEPDLNQWLYTWEVRL